MTVNLQDSAQSNVGDFALASTHASLPIIQGRALPTFSKGLIQSKVMGNDIGAPALDVK